MTKEFNTEYIDDAVFDMAEKFNSNKFKQQSQNYVRHESLTMQRDELMD